MFDATRKIQRSAEIASILIKYGFDDIVDRLPWTKKQLSRLKIVRSKGVEGIYERIRAAIEELGPVFVKLAQTLSTREGLLPSELIEEFKKLEDQVEGVQNTDIVQLLEKELGILTSDHFLAIDSQPLAAASVSEVFSAELISGKKVILKVRRPNIIDRVKVDLALIRDIALILSTYQPKFRNLNLPMIAKSFEQTTLEELSFSNERLNIKRFAKNFKSHKNLYVPKIYEQYCTDSVLCMEYIDGIKITEMNPNDLNYDIPTIVNEGLNVYLEQIIEHGFFHGDPHPGNLMVLKNNKLVFLDFGNMGRLIESDQKQLESFIFSIVLGDVDWLAEIITEVAIVKNIKDEALFKRSLAEIIDMVQNASLGEININSIVQKLWVIIFDNGLYFPEYIYQLIRGLTLMEGIGRKLYPELSLYESIKPYAQKIFLKKLEPKNLWKENRGMLISYMRLIYRVPKDLNQLINLFKSGNIKHNHQIAGLTGINRTVRIGVNKVVLSLIFMSLMILSGFIILADLQPKLLGLPIWSLVFLGAGFLILLLIVRNNVVDKNTE